MRIHFRLGTDEPGFIIGGFFADCYTGREAYTLSNCDYTLYRISYLIDCYVRFDFSTMDCRFVCLLVALAALASVQHRPVGAHKILMMPLQGKSHLFPMAAIAKGLASRGHQVSSVRVYVLRFFQIS